MCIHKILSLFMCYIKTNIGTRNFSDLLLNSTIMTDVNKVTKNSSFIIYKNMMKLFQQQDYWWMNVHETRMTFILINVNKRRRQFNKSNNHGNEQLMS